MSTFQELVEGIKNPKQHHELRISLIKEIDGITKRKLIVYVSDFNKSHPAVPNSINPLDITAFSDLIENINEDKVDILIQSPGGLAETTEQLVQCYEKILKIFVLLYPEWQKALRQCLYFLEIKS